MPQGKLKVKVKVPGKQKAKKKPAALKKKKGGGVAPAKKAKHLEAQKLKKLITKTVNSTAEEQLRAVALDGSKALAKIKGTKEKKKKK